MNKIGCRRCQRIIEWKTNLNRSKSSEANNSCREKFENEISKLNIIIRNTQPTFASLVLRRGKITCMWKSNPVCLELRGAALVMYQCSSKKNCPLSRNKERIKVFDLTCLLDVKSEISQSQKQFPFVILLSKNKPLKFAALSEEIRLEWIKLLKKIRLPLGIYNIKLRSTIGEGHFGKVFLAQKGDNSLNRDNLLAIKEIKLTNKKSMITALNERILFASLPRHPFVIHLQMSFRNGNYLYYGFDFMAGADLFELMKYHDMVVNIKSASFYAAQISLALEHLHKNGIVYRDLKPENILVDLNGNLKLADLGLSKKISSNRGCTYSLCGTRAYLAPEMIRYDRPGYGFSADIWQLGCFIYELYDGQSPFWSNNVADRGMNIDPSSAQSAKILAGEISRPSDIDDSAWDLTLLLLKTDPMERIGCSKVSKIDPNGWMEIKKHPFFNEYKWEDILSLSVEPPFKPADTKENILANFSKKYTIKRPRWGAEEEKIVGNKIENKFNEELKGFAFVHPNTFDETKPKYISGMDIIFSQGGTSTDSIDSISVSSNSLST